MIGMSQELDDADDMDEEADVAAPEQPLPQPPETQITIERFPDGLTINVPPAGLWRGSHGLFAFGIIWVGAMAVLTPLLVASILSGKGAEQGGAMIVPALLSLFWLVGIGLLLGGLNMGRRRAAIAVTGGTLMIIQTGIFGTKQRQWPATTITRVYAGASGMEVNDKPILELQISAQGSSRFGLLAGRTDEELQWIASELRASLGLT